MFTGKSAPRRLDLRELCILVVMKWLALSSIYLDDTPLDCRPDPCGLLSNALESHRIQAVEDKIKVVKRSSISTG